jgi:hypothetical protein
MADSLELALRRHAQQVLTLETDEAKRYLRELLRLRGKLAVRLQDVAGKSGKIDAFFVRRAFLETETAIAALEKRFKQMHLDLVDRSEDLAFSHVFGETERMWQRFERTAIPAGIKPEVVLSDQVRGLLANQFSTSVTRYGAEVLGTVQREILFGLRSGEAVRDMTKRLTSLNGPLFSVAPQSAERLIRTEVSQAYGVAQHESGEALKKKVPDAQKMWWHVSSYKCEVCIGLHQTTRAMGGVWTITTGKKKKRTRKVAHAPAHPNCTCRILTVRPKWKQALSSLGYIEGEAEKIPAVPVRAKRAA